MSDAKIIDWPVKVQARRESEPPSYVEGGGIAVRSVVIEGTLRRASRAKICEMLSERLRVGRVSGYRFEPSGEIVLELRV
jgi:hypothetical protein